MSFELFYKEYYYKVYSYILRRIGNSFDAEDLTDTVFSKCYKNYDRYDPSKASYGTWLYTIMSNTLKNYYKEREKSIMVDVDELNEVADTDSDGFIKSVENQQLRDLLATALETLPEDKRKIIVLKYFKNKNAEQIAEIMGMSSVNVRVTLKRSLAKLEEYFVKNNIKVDL